MRMRKEKGEKKSFIVERKQLMADVVSAPKSSCTAVAVVKRFTLPYCARSRVFLASLYYYCIVLYSTTSSLK